MLFFRSATPADPSTGRRRRARLVRTAKVGVPLLATGIVAAAVAPALWADDSQAANAPMAGREKVQDYAKVRTVIDGDTIWVTDSHGKFQSIRHLGLNAMEVKHAHSGDNQCNGQAARKLVMSVVKKGDTVQLRSIHKGSKSGDRLRRAVFYKDRETGQWRDLQRLVLDAGLAVWMPNNTEYSHNAEYEKAAARAIAARKGIWGTASSCQVKASSKLSMAPGAKLAVRVNFDPPGSDDNRESVVVTNNGRSTVRLGGWWLRDSVAERYTFPSGTSLAPGTSVTVRVAKGRSTASIKYWGISGSIFNNPDPARGLGDGGYLYDPAGNIRAFQMYPCVMNCTAKASLAGLTVSRIVANPDGADAGNEFVQLRSTAKRRIALTGFSVVTKPYAYRFKAGTYLDPGETLTVRVRKGSSNRLVQSWGLSKAILNNDGDVVQVRADDGTVVLCKAYGTKHC